MAIHDGRPNPGAKRHDWEAVRLAYVEGALDDDGLVQFPNLREVSEMHGVDYSRCRQHAAREGWKEQRAGFQRQIEDARRAERAGEAARQMETIDDQALRAARTGMVLTLHRLDEVARAVREARAPQSQDDGMAELYEPLDVKELKDLARTAREWRELAAQSLGIAVGTTAVEISGQGGGPVDLRQELMLDDSENSRVTGIIVAMERAGLLAQRGGEAGHPALGNPENP